MSLRLEQCIEGWHIFDGDTSVVYVATDWPDAEGRARRAYARLLWHARTETAVSTFDWHAQAACRGEDVDLFYDPALYERGKTFCAKCPVAEDCLLDAADDHWGVRGGLDPKQRQRLAGAAA